MVDLRGPLQNAARQVWQAAEISYLQTGNERGSNVTYFYKAYAELVKATLQLDPDGDYEGFIYSSLDNLLENFYDAGSGDSEHRSIYLAYKFVKDSLRDYVNRGGVLTGDKGQFIPASNLAKWGDYMQFQFRLSITVTREILLEVLKERNLQPL